MYALLWLLLPVAAASGWWVALYSQKMQKRQSRARFNSAYGQGLNYLLNEQPDKAVEVLVQLVEVDPDTLELHLALGSLFRRRGEVDRAIRVHQNIIARVGLSEALRDQASLELGRDYLKAGLLDRAEQLFNSLLGRSADERAVCRHLVDIYQQEKEWARAIAVARRIAGSDPAHWRIRIAHYHCELGDAALAEGDFTTALVEAERACCEDSGCVRALLLKASACQHAGDFHAAIEAYHALGSQSQRLIPEIRQELQSCYDRLGPQQSPAEDAGDTASQALSGAARLEPVTRFRCEQCGFSSRKLFWQCPSCKSWSSVKPLGQNNTE
jgi:lipopolysaccharide biosynthesis regulator YciM